ASRLANVMGLADYKSQIFTALNTSFLHDGAYVVVPDGKVVEQPIEVVYLAAPLTKAAANYPRTLVVAGKNSQVSVVETFFANRAVAAAPAYFTNAVTEIALAENAVVDHYKVQQESLHAYHIANTQVAQARGSNFSTHFLSLGGGLV